MTCLLNIFRIVTCVWLAGGLAGCSLKPAARGADAAAPAAPIQLTATLVNPLNVELKWKDTAGGAAGYVVEFATNPKEEFTILGFLRTNQTTFMHPDLMPETKFYYRVRAFFGPACTLAGVSTGKSAPETTGDAVADDWAEPKSIPVAVTAAKKSIRSALTVAEAAPTDLKAALVRSTGIKLTWTDHASDEEGYLLEVKSDEIPDFRVGALMDPNINLIGLSDLPPETKFSFRVRAFFYGKPSNLAAITTGLDPEAGAATAGSEPPKIP